MRHAISKTKTAMKFVQANLVCTGENRSRADIVKFRDDY